jgi:hypothetical protein
MNWQIDKEECYFLNMLAIRLNVNKSYLSMHTFIKFRRETTVNEV